MHALMVIVNKRAMMAQVRSPEYHWNQIISKSLHRFSRRSPLKLFLFIALAAILFNRAEGFEQFWWTVTKGAFLYNYFKINALVKEEKSFKVFFLFLALAAILFNGADWFEQLW